MVKQLFAFLFLLAPLCVSAGEPWQWTLIAPESHIRWQATQNNAPVKGGFETFSAQIAFHPDALQQSQVTVTVDTSSITTSYDEAQSTLKTKEWFNVDAFPKATFQTQSFEALKEQNRYRALSTLTIKGKTVPVTLDFTLHQLNETSAHMTGETIIKRTDFGIGWSETAQIDDEVIVKIEIKASR